MSPRPYSMEKRDAATNKTRLRILEATRQILADESEAVLGMEAIARRADVSRLTIYYQFKSRPGLLEALYDYLAMRGNMHRMGEVFHEPDPDAALDKVVSVFVGFWSSDRVVIRRLRAMAALDLEIREGIESRDARRQHIARKILQRIAAAGNKKYDDERLSTIADVIAMLTGFATYDALATAGHGEKEIMAIVARLAHFAASESINLRQTGTGEIGAGRSQTLLEVEPGKIILIGPESGNIVPGVYAGARHAPKVVFAEIVSRSVQIGRNATSNQAKISGGVATK